MLQFDVALYRTTDNVAHLSALVTRQAGKLRRYKNGGSVGVYLRRWARHLPDVNGALPRLGVRAIVVFARHRNRTSLAELFGLVPANGGSRLRRISAFLPEASLRVQSGGFL